MIDRFIYKICGYLDDYKKENPDIQLMGDKFIKPSKKKLKIPKYLTDDESVILPLPKPKVDD